MQAVKEVKEKVKNVASTAKAQVEIHKAKSEEKKEMRSALTAKEKGLAHEQRRLKETEAKMKLIEAKAQHKMEKEGADTAKVGGTTGAYRGNDILVATHDHHGGHHPDGALRSSTENVAPADVPTLGAHTAKVGSTTGGNIGNDMLVATHDHHGGHYADGALLSSTETVAPADVPTLGSLGPHLA